MVAWCGGGVEVVVVVVSEWIGLRACKGRWG